MSWLGLSSPLKSWRWIWNTFVQLVPHGAVLPCKDKGILHSTSMDGETMVCWRACACIQHCLFMVTQSESLWKNFKALISFQFLMLWMYSFSSVACSSYSLYTSTSSGQVLQVDTWWIFTIHFLLVQSSLTLLGALYHSTLKVKLQATVDREIFVVKIFSSAWGATKIKRAKY